MQILTPYIIGFGVFQKIKNEWLPQEQEPVSSFGAESKFPKFQEWSDLMLLGFQLTLG